MEAGKSMVMVPADCLTQSCLLFVKHHCWLKWCMLNLVRTTPPLHHFPKYSCHFSFWSFVEGKPSYFASLSKCSMVGLFNFRHLDVLYGDITLYFFKDFIYLSLERREGRKRGRETSVCGCPSHTPYWGPGLQPSHMFWLGIKPATLCFADRRSIHWATPARVHIVLLIYISPMTNDFECFSCLHLANIFFCMNAYSNLLPIINWICFYCFIFQLLSFENSLYTSYTLWYPAMYYEK